MSSALGSGTMRFIAVKILGDTVLFGPVHVASALRHSHPTSAAAFNQARPPAPRQRAHQPPGRPSSFHLPRQASSALSGLRSGSRSMRSPSGCARTTFQRCSPSPSPGRRCRHAPCSAAAFPRRRYHFPTRSLPQRSHCATDMRCDLLGCARLLRPCRGSTFGWCPCATSCSSSTSCR